MSDPAGGASPISNTSIASSSSPSSRAAPLQPLAALLPDLNLDVKALVQPLGSENSWNELGDGRVEFHGHSIRVVNYDAVTNHQQLADNNTSSNNNNNNNNKNAAADDSELYPSQPSPQVVLEDTITDDTPFVGENSCIVWNSLDQQLSLCIMFMSDQGYAAAWSALHATQHKQYPPIEFDFLAPCRAPVPGTPSSTTANDNKQEQHQHPESLVPYSAIINQRHVPPLGYIEKHALACSIMEFDHGAEPALFADVHTCVTLLKFCHADLLEYLVSERAYPHLLRGLESAAKIAPWVVPPGLADTVPTSAAEDVTLTINTSLRLHHLKHEVLPVGIDEEVIAVIDSLNHRLHNELICTLLADDGLFRSIVQLLMTTLNNSNNTVGGGHHHYRGGGRRPLSLENGEKRPDSAAPRPPSAPADAPTSVHPRPPSRGFSVGSTASDGAAAPLSGETIVANCLHFLTSFFAIAVSAFAKELMAHLIAKVFEGGLLEALSVVAQRFLTPSLSSSPPPSGAAGDGFNLTMNSAPGAVIETTISIDANAGGGGRNGATASREGARSGNSPSRGTPAAIAHSVLVERHMMQLLDATITRLNEKTEENVMTIVFRQPMLAEPEKHLSLLLFIGRCLLKAPDDFIGKNNMLAFHLLGLHDDEGSGCERNSDADIVMRRNDFHKFFIETVVKDVCRGRTMPLPSLPPAPQSSQQQVPSGASSAASSTNSASGPSGLTASESAAVSPSSDVAEQAPATPLNTTDSERIASAATTTAAGGSTAAPPTITLVPPRTPPAGSFISPAFIRVLEYLYLLTSEANRTILTATILHPKSYVMKFIEVSARNLLSSALLASAGRSTSVLSSSSASSPTTPLLITRGSQQQQQQQQQQHMSRKRIENLTGNLRFLKALLQYGGQPALRCCTVDKDVLRPYLQLYCALGGPRKRSLFHSTVLSLLFLVRADPRLADCQRYLLLKHRALLPVEFAARCDDDALQELTAKIQGIESGVHMTPTPSRAATPGFHNHGGMLDVTPGGNNSSAHNSSGGSGGRRRHVDEVTDPSSAEAMEEVAMFPPRLRTLIGRLSPTPPPDATGGSGSSGSSSHGAGASVVVNKMPSPAQEHLEIAPPKQPRKPTAPSGSGKSGSSGSGPRRQKGVDSSASTGSGKTLLRNL